MGEPVQMLNNAHIWPTQLYMPLGWSDHAYGRRPCEIHLVCQVIKRQQFVQGCGAHGWRVDLSSGSLDLGSRLLSTTYRVPTFGSVPSVHSSECRYCQCQTTSLTGCTSCCLALTPPLHMCLGKLWPWQQEPIGGTHGLWVYRVLLALWCGLVVGSRWGLAVSGSTSPFPFSFWEWLVGHPLGALLPGPPDISVGL